MIKTNLISINNVTKEYSLGEINYKSFIYDFKNVTDSLKMTCENMENLIDNSKNNFVGDESINNIIEKEKLIVFYNLFQN